MDKIGSDPFAPPLYPHLGALEKSPGTGNRYAWVIKRAVEVLARGFVSALDGERAMKDVRDAAVSDNFTRPFLIEIYKEYHTYLVDDVTKLSTTREDGSVVE